MDDNESVSDSTSSTLTLNSGVDAAANSSVISKDGVKIGDKVETSDATERDPVNAQKLSDEVEKVRRKILQEYDYKHT